LGRPFPAAGGRAPFGAGMAMVFTIEHYFSTRSQASGAISDLRRLRRQGAVAISGARLVRPERKKRSEEGRDYLSVKLDDPALTQPLNCALVEPSDSEGFILVWSRDSRKAKAD
jgi:Protein of unknown function (DUF736)